VSYLGKFELSTHYQRKKRHTWTDCVAFASEADMFCPGCGLKEERAVQYCRACGTDLGTVRNGLAQPDAAATSLASAREEVARALATRIQQGEWWQTESLMAEMAKLFESPEERRWRLIHAGEAARLRRVRAGVITSAIGLGETLLCLLLSFMKPDLLVGVGPGLIVFLIGLAILLNGLVFTRHKISAKGPSPSDESSLKNLVERFDKSQAVSGVTRQTTDALGDAQVARPPLPAGSVTEQTTRHLSSES